LIATRGANGDLPLKFCASSKVPTLGARWQETRLRFRSRASLLLPVLTAVPVVDIPANTILLDAVAFLNLAFKLIAPAGDLVEVVVSESTPLLFHLALELLPVSFDTVPIHCDLLFSDDKARCWRGQAAGFFAD
jgi:hypothetical protein